MAEKIMHVMPSALRDENILRTKSRIVDLVAPDLQKIPSSQLNRRVVREHLEKGLDEQKVGDNIGSAVRQQLVDSALADLIGYGPLELLLGNPGISEIMVNGPLLTFVDRT